MAHAFITYGPGDEAASIIVDSYLRVVGVKTWRPPAVHERANPPTRHWESLRTAGVLIVLWSARAAESPHVECDWGYGTTRRLPVFIVALDDTPLPARLAHARHVGALPGSATLPDLAAAVEAALGQDVRQAGFINPIDEAFVDFACWFFDELRWHYDPARALFPLQVGGLPNLPAETCAVRFLRARGPAQRARYALLNGPAPLLLFEFEAEDAFLSYHFFQAVGWYYDGLAWTRYEWTRCDHCSRWQLTPPYREGAAQYRTWCPLCRVDVRR